MYVCMWVLAGECCCCCCWQGGKRRGAGERRGEARLHKKIHTSLFCGQLAAGWLANTITPPCPDRRRTIFAVVALLPAAAAAAPLPPLSLPPLLPFLQADCDIVVTLCSQVRRALLK